MQNESILVGNATGTKGSNGDTTRFVKRQNKATYGYAVLTAALVAGWMLRGSELVDPEEGLGYWLGIVGASMMLLLLLYPLRKKISVLRIFGPIRHWFRIHMIFGLVGPLLILYHCNFTLASINGRVAMFSMLLVASSGIIGRHFYSKIHRGLYGKKTNLRELQEEMSETLDANNGLAALMPNLSTCLEMLSTELQGDKITRSVSVSHCLKWTLKQPLMRYRLKRIARGEILEQAASSPIIARDSKRIRRSANTYINNYLKLLSRVAQFSMYERLFSMWHVFHLPLFFMLVLSASVHVIAVHMY